MDASKKYIVRNAVLGDATSSSTVQHEYIVKDGGRLEINAIDNISTHDGFIVDNGGEAVFHSDRSVNLNGVQIKKGGKLWVYAKEVTFGKDFKIDKGGEFKIINY